MTRLWLAALLAMPVVAGLSPSAAAQAPDATGLAGRWTLNAALSQMPKEVGFSADWMSAGTAGGDGTGGARGGQAGGGASRTNFPVIKESREDSARIKALTTEVREPSARLTIVETATDVTITTDNNSSRTFHPGLAIGDSFPLPDSTVGATTRREAGKLVITYKVVQGRELRSEATAMLETLGLHDLFRLQRGRGVRSEVRRVLVRNLERGQLRHVPGEHELRRDRDVSEVVH